MFTLFLPVIADVPGALQHTPDRVRDPYLDDGQPPGGVTQVYFDSIAELERAATLHSGEAEAMEVHHFPVRREMRADFAHSPTYRGRVAHDAMTTKPWRSC